MRKYAFVIALALLVSAFGITASVSAGPNDNWVVYLKAAAPDGTNYLGTGIFGTKTDATDTPAEITRDASNSPGSGSGAVIACFDLGLGTAENGYYKDLRAPISAPWTSSDYKVWNLKIWAQPKYTYSDIVLTAWNPTGTYDINGGIPISLRVVHDPTGTYADNTWLFQAWDSVKNGSSKSPAYSFTFTGAGSLKSLDNAIELQFGFVPEPGSLVAMFSLFGGFSGLALLRKFRA